MLKATRIIFGSALAASILQAATLATRDCTVGLYSYDNCLWVWTRELLGLPSSKLLRACFLELVGLALAAALLLTIRFVFPPWRRGAHFETPRITPPTGVSAQN